MDNECAPGLWGPQSLNPWDTECGRYQSHMNFDTEAQEEWKPSKHTKLCAKAQLCIVATKLTGKSLLSNVRNTK